MPSLLHEGVLELVREQPAFAASLLGQILDVQLPPFTQARLTDTALNQILPVEYRADAVVVFAREIPVYGAIIEAQLQRDDEKQFSWPYYATGARARHRCPFVVIVIALDSSTARWASQQLDLGGGNYYRPLVVEPDNIPRVTDLEHAVRDPQLAMLSAIAHGRGDFETAVAIAVAVMRGLLQIPEDQRELHSVLLQRFLPSEVTRKVMAMYPGIEKFYTDSQRQSHARERAEGRAEGKAENILRLLELRKFTVDDAHRERILGCRDLAVLDRWLERVLSITTTEELFA